MEVTEVNYTDPSENLEVHAESGGNPWPCAFMVLAVCLMILGICWGGVYWLTNLPQ